jgi:cytochrome c oxidase cbb3-type subunit 4
MSYDALRHFADSWGLLFLVVVFVGVVVWVFRPGASYDDQAGIPFRNDDGKD